MKSFKLFLLLLICFFSLNAEIEINYHGDNIEVNGSFNILENETISKDDFSHSRLNIEQCSNTNIQGYEIPVLTKFISLPANGNYKISTSNLEFKVVKLTENIIPFVVDNILPEIDYNRDEWLPDNVVTIGRPAIMRGNRFTQITIAAIQYNPAQKSIRLISDIDLELNIDSSDNRNPLSKQISSGSFSKIVSNKVIGANPNRPEDNGQYLFIAPQACQEILQPLLRWKEKLGYSTHLAIFEEIGSNEADIKDYLQNAYDNWDTPPEFVVLVGDVDGSYTLPSYFIPGYLYPWCVTDHPFTLLDGDDYFPDVLIGRLSVRSEMQLMTIISKIIKYERNPHMNTDWMKSALMAGYVDGYNGFSQREVLMGIRDKLLDFEYTKVDTFISPWQSGATQLSSEINNGHSFVCYRGAGHSTYWSGGTIGHMLTSNDVLNLNNGYMLPMVTSMTCGGGDFAAVEAPSCFGETWMMAGSPTTPQGAIGFIGPSERDTKTWFNNANAMGIYQGITQEDVTSCGEMLLRGKMELYNNYPFGHEMGGSVDSDQFYFYVYNLLGDPGLNIWTDIPKTVELQISDYVEGMNYISVEVLCEDTDLSGFTIAVTSQNSLLATDVTSASGTVNIPVTLDGGNFNVTASKYGYIPETIDLTVGSTDNLGVQNFEFSEFPVSGTSLDLDFEIYNFSHLPASDILVELIPQDGNIEILSDPISAASLANNDILSAQFHIKITEEWLDDQVSELLVIITSNFGENTSLVPVQISSPELIYANHIVLSSTGCLIQNVGTQLKLELKNIGSTASGNIDVQLSCLNEAAQIHNSGSNFSNIEPEATGQNNTDFTLTPENLFSGEIVSFMMEVNVDGMEVQSLFFDIPIGIVTEESPTLCDYGYFATESRDEGDFQSPIYDWVELDPDQGGSGILMNADHTIIDGYIKTLNMPFEVRYFGKFYSTISVCSEGYLTLGSTDQIFFRNRNIPSGIGPAGMVAPFWDALDGGKIYIQHDTEQHRFIIEWLDWGNVIDPTIRNTFEVILYDPDYYDSGFIDGDILFQYKEIHNIDQDDHYATIGIENEIQTEGLLLTFAGIDAVSAHPIESETAIWFQCMPNESIPYLSTDKTEISVVVESDTTIPLEITLFNHAEANADLEYELSFSHFNRGINSTNRDINRSLENDFIIQSSGNYIPIMPTETLFYLVHNSPENEPIYGVRIDFPAGFVVNSATDMADLYWNEETGNGAEVSWGFGNGSTLSTGSPFIMKVYLTIEPDLQDPVYIDWYIEGDGSGAAPHSINGSLEVFSTTEDHLWVTYPNGGETILPGIQDTIRWNKYGALENVKIELQRDNEAEYELVTAATENDGEFAYLFSGPLSNECKIWISSEDEEVRDKSDSLFAISALNVIYPNEITVMSYNSADSILWENIGGIETVDIEFSTDYGFTWSVLAAAAPNTGRYDFTVPGPPSENCIVKLVSSELNCSSQTDRFSIVDSPISWLDSETTSGIIHPAGSETITVNVSTTGLELGNYSAIIKFETSIGQVHYVPINLECIKTLPPGEVIVLYQNHPNPFNPFTQIDFTLKEQSHVKLSIYNARGQIVKTLINEILPAGEKFKGWDGTDKYNRKLSSGVYFYKVTAGKQTEAKKMILIK
jgi:Peptidase family C25/Propeptide_C25/FlgD Ig-like domain